MKLKSNHTSYFRKIYQKVKNRNFTKTIPYDNELKLSAPVFLYNLISNIDLYAYLSL